MGRDRRVVAKVRVHELAKELGVDSKTVLATLREQGEFVKSASSTIEAPVIRRLREKFPAQPAEDGQKDDQKKEAPKKPAPRKPGPKPSAPAPEAPAGEQQAEATAAPAEAAPADPAPAERQPES